MKKLFILFDLILFTGMFGLFATAQQEVQQEVQQVDVEAVSSASYNLQLYGAKAAEKENEFTLEQMIRYSIEDERVATAQNELLMEKFDKEPLFSNIITEENANDGELLKLCKKYDFEILPFDAKGHVSNPGTLKETFNIGIAAETKNIAMYDTFLNQDLDEDVRVVFIELRDGTVKHLDAFKEQVSKY